MHKFCCILLLTFGSLITFLEASESVCSSGKKRSMSLSINSTRDDDDEWLTKFFASRNSSGKPKHLEVELTQSLVDCNENYFVSVQGIVKGSEKTQEQTELYFHNKCSDNAAITNEARTLQKLRVNGQGSAQTYRPLKDDEVFTVRIDKLDPNLDHGVAIGVTSNPPGSYNIPDHMNTLSTNLWMFYHTHLYHKSKEYNSNYLSTNLRDLKVGQRIGVMRSKSGTLHFFLDGKDKGPAASNIPENVFGVLEMYGKFLQGTIVDS